MGERIGQQVASAGLSLALLVPMLAAPAAVHAAKAACDQDEHPALKPPLEEAAVVVRVKWDNTTDYLFEYGVTTSSDPIDDPQDGGYASWVGGCHPPLVDICHRLDPVVITEQPLSYEDVNGNDVRYPNAGTGAGTYTVYAEPAGFCSYNTQPDPDGPRYGDIDRLERTIANAPDAVPLTVTIESFDGDGNRVFGPVGVTAEVPPGWSDQAERSRRILGSFDWDPDTGISNVVDAGAEAAAADQIAELAPLLPGTIAAAPPDSYDDSASAEGPARSGAGATRDVELPDQILRVEKLLFGLAKEFVDSTLRRSHEEWEEGVSKGWQLVLAAIVLEILGAEARGEDTSDLVEALNVLALFVILRPDDLLDQDASDTTADASDSSPTVAEPKKPNPPKLTGKAKRRFEKQGREWVWLPAPVVIKVTYPEVAERTLKTGVWYQMKEHEEGDREFFSRKGSRIGTSLSEDKDTFEVRRWEGAKEVGE